MQLPIQRQSAEVEPGLEWLNGLGEPALVARKLSALGLRDSEGSPPRRAIHSLIDRGAFRPVGSWLFDLMLRVFDSRGVGRMTALELRDALHHYGEKTISKSLLTPPQLEALLRRASVFPVNRRLRKNKRLVYVRSSFLRRPSPPSSVIPSLKSTTERAGKHTRARSVRRARMNRLGRALSRTADLVRRQKGAAREIRAELRRSNRKSLLLPAVPIAASPTPPALTPPITQA